MKKPGSTRKTLGGEGQSLADRVQSRVVAAAEVRERRDRAARPKIRPARRQAASSAALPPDREARALKDVFLDLGRRYHQYRERTGNPIAPDVRSAARAFKTEPSLVALIPVAGFLDELSLLDW